jgi:hypothetical protein
VLGNREANSTMKTKNDILTTGYQKFQSSSLATFNKKLTVMKQGGISQPEVDGIMPCQVIENADIDKSGPGEISKLHDDSHDE